MKRLTLIRHFSSRDRILRSVRERLKSELSIRLIFWDGAIFDFSLRPTIAITLRSPRILRMLMLGRMGRLAEAYIQGELLVDGKIEDIIAIGIDLAERIGRSGFVTRFAQFRSYVPLRHTRGRDKSNAQYHYDVSNEFFALWLDQHMIYSCAYFRQDSDTLDAAQEQKLDHICRKLALRPGDRLLDIGCGWGGLLRWAAKRYGVTGVGLTLSRKQYDYARERAAAEGLSDRVDIRLQDYRELSGQAEFDKVVSVGMYEHVGIANLPIYFSTIMRLLKPGGVALNHGITTGDPSGRAQGPPGGEFIDQYVFPGGEVPHLAQAIAGIARAGLEVVDVEDLRPHYARTLVHWVRRLEQRASQAQAEAGPDRYRIWRMYMAAMAFAFDRGWLSVAQILAYKGHGAWPAPRPFTRDYQYNPESNVAIAGRLNWSEIGQSELASFQSAEGES